LISPLGQSEFSHESQIANRGTSRDDAAPRSDARLRIAETFASRQGEGKLTGTPSFFIRTSGCNLRCWFCDTPYASWQPKGEAISIDSLVSAAVEAEVQHVVLTGGEPMLPPDSVSLCQALQDAGMHVTIETAGTVDRVVPCDLMSISPKFRSSAPDAALHANWAKLHEQRRLPIETMKRLVDRSPEHQLKFVVDSPEDYDELESIVDRVDVDAGDVWVMPQGSTIEALDEAIEWLKPWCESVGFRYCDRMQIRWFGNRRGT
jgi:7-carboxy-7-deazaguanine synthase